MAKYGFNVTIGADTTAFSKALRQLNQPIQEAQSNITKLNNALKFEPSSTVLLSQKQQALQNELEETRNKADKLKQALINLDKEQQGNSGITLEQKEKYNSLMTEMYATETRARELEEQLKGFGSVGLQQVSALGTAMQDLGEKISNIGEKLLIVSGAVGGLMGVGIKYNMDIEKSTKAFEVFTGSAEQAEDIVNKIREDSKQSIFDTSALINANKLLVSSGVDAEKARKSINDMADILALAGGSNDELNRMAYNLQQIANNGKATARDIRQFGDAGIPIYKMLADTLGVTTEEVKDMDISFDLLAETFAKATSEGGKFANGQELISQTASGSLNRLKKTFDETLGVLTETLMPTITRILNGATNVLKKIQELDPQTKNLITTIGVVAVVLGPALILIGKVISSIGVILALLPKIMMVMTNLFGVVKVVVAGIGGLLKGLFTLIMAHPVIAVATVIIGALVLLYNKCEWFRNVVNNIVKAIWNFFANFGENMKKLFTQTIPNIIGQMIQFFQTLPYRIGYIIGQVLGHLVKFGVDALKWCITNVPKIINGIITFFASLPGNLWNILLSALSKVGDFLSNMWNTITSRLPGIVQSIVDWFNSIDLWEVGWNIIEGLWNGISNAKDWLWSKIKGFAQGILNGFKDSLGIHSPSKLFENVIGKNIALGIGEGFDNNIGNITKDMVGQINGITSDINVAGGTGTVTLQFYPQQMTEADLEMAFNYVNRRFGTQY